jgi:sulfatase modifying factor 1
LAVRKPLSPVVAAPLVSRRSVLRAAGIAALSPLTSMARRQSFGGVAAGEQREVAGVALCWCPAGRFTMGSPASEIGHRADEAQVDVTLTRGFWIGKFEVTQSQWRKIAGPFPDKPPAPAWGIGDDSPVYWVNLTEAEGFCRALTRTARESGALAADWEFRLPTEAQWEYASRAGTVTATSFGGALGRTHANFAGALYNGGPDGPAARRATRAGSYPPNPWGICDMHGNVFEWCRDWYHSRLPGGVDPDLHATRGTANRDGTYSRVRRGGAWNDDGVFCRSALRLRYEPERRSDHIGFRIVAVQA